MPSLADVPERLASALAGRYANLRPLGRGGMADVYLALDVRHDREVAIKVLRAEVAGAIGAERFLREIHTVARLQHPNIVPLFDSGEADGIVYYVMPHIQGGSLRERLRREKQLPVAEALAIAAAVGEALEEAHAHDIVHRDIKPENILFSGGRAVVTDFGLARAIGQLSGSRLTRTGIVVGTTPYMAPEQIAGGRSVDTRADIYALACVLYEMLVGQPPYTAATDEALLARHMFEPPPSARVVRRAVPEKVDAAIQRALAKTPADRFQKPHEFIAALGGAPRRPAAQWMWPLFGAGLATAAIAGLLVLSSRRAPTSPVTQPDLTRIAVLYFDAATGDSLTWLAHGLTEDLIDALSTVEGLSVTSRNGVMPFRGVPVSPDSIGRTLSVGLIVDGTVTARRDSMFEVTVRLIETSRGTQLERLSQVARSLDEPLALRAAITADLEQALRRRIGQHVRVRQERLAASNDQAWERVQRAREAWNEGLALHRASSAAAAVRAFERADSLLATAERIAPDWTEPTIHRADLARVSIQISDTNGTSGGFREHAADLIDVGLAHTDRALARDPSNPHALSVRGELLFARWQLSTASSDTLLTEALRVLEAAVAHPAAPARASFALSQVLLVLGRASESRIAAERALREDVYAEEAPTALAQLFFAALHESRARADSLCVIGQRHHPTNGNFIQCEFILLGWFGHGPEEVDRAIELAAELDTVEHVMHGRTARRLYIAAVFARSGDPAAARAEIEKARALAGDEASWRLFAEMEAYVVLLLGERDQAVRLLETVLAEEPGAREWVAAHPWFRSLSTDSSFLRLVNAR